MSQPPLLPDLILARMLRVARLDGLSVTIVAAIAALLAAASRDYVGAVIGLLVAGAGAMELHGVGVLHAGEKRGMTWLIGAQLFLLATLLIYCGWKLTHIDLAPWHAAFQRSLEFPGMSEKWAEARRLGITEDEYLLLIYRLTYCALAFATFIYQGGMILYYRSRREAVGRALDAE